MKLLKFVVLSLFLSVILFAFAGCSSNSSNYNPMMKMGRI